MADLLLVNAAKLGNLEQVRILLQEGCDVNEEDEYGYSALIYAARCGHLEIASLLLENGARINHQNKLGSTALYWAAGYIYLSIVSLLIEKGADLNIQNNDGYTPLMISALCGHFAIVYLLLQNGADPTLMNKLGKTALDLARERNKSGCVGILEKYEHFHRYRKAWLSFSASLRSFQEDQNHNQNQEFKQSQIQCPSLMRVMDSSDLVRYLTEFM